MTKRQVRVISGIPGTIATARPPEWKNEDAVYDWVINRKRHALLQAMGLEESQGAVVKWGQLTIVYEPQIDSFLDPDPEPSDEELAVEAAMGGRFQKLEDLIESEIRNWEENPDYRLKFSPSTLRRVLEFASGKRNVKTGKPKGKPGAPKLGASERSRRTPTHDGGNYYFPAIREVLRQEYPGQKPEDYRDRAYNFAARMATSLKTGMKVNDTKGKGEKVKGETLAGYRNRGRRGRGPHRI